MVPRSGNGNGNIPLFGAAYLTLLVEKVPPFRQARWYCLLMVQKSGNSPVEVGKFFHFLQGFFYIPGWFLARFQPSTDSTVSQFFEEFKDDVEASVLKTSKVPVAPFFLQTSNGANHPHLVATPLLVI